MSAVDDLLAWSWWRWMPGMRDSVRDRGLDVDDGGFLFWVELGRHGGITRVELDDSLPGAIPDLGHPGTLGCIDELLREAWGPDAAITVHRWPNGEGFIEIRIGLDMVLARCAEPFADALVRACLAATPRGES